jgi:sulfur transfer complex TusBCD TusB component (DsrH family)
MDQENVVLVHNGIYSAMKKNEILSFAGKWMELENIILSEVNQAQKTKNCMFSLICGLQI